MGLDTNGTRALLWLRKNGACLDRVACLGRQTIRAGPAALSRAFRAFGIADTDVTRFADCYCEEMLHFLGAKEVRSFDACNYEQATDIHDFNLALEDKYRDYFDLVIDGGTLEHVFNVQIAFANAMQMIRPGGRYLGLTPTNNFCGHGFYQFSPEFYFRVFTTANGFQLEHVVAHEDIPEAPWFCVIDPDKLGERVTLVNSMPTYLIVVARKLASRDRYFTIAPAQSDYVAAWSRTSASELVVGPDGASQHISGRLRTLIRLLAPNGLRRYCGEILGRRASEHFRRDQEALKRQSPMLQMTKCFTPFDPSEPS
jgi:SAM-dependent methyltransferase